MGSSGLLKSDFSLAFQVRLDAEPISDVDWAVGVFALLRRS